VLFCGIPYLQGQVCSQISVSTLSSSAVSGSTLSLFGPRVSPGPRTIPLPLIPLLPHLLLYLLVSFTFPIFAFVLASSVFLLFHPFPFLQNSPIPFPGRMSYEATKPGFSFFVLILCYMYF